MQTPMPQRRTAVMWPIFAAINGILIALVTYAIGTNNLASLGSAAYVITLSVLCFLPLCLTPSVRGRHALSLTFLALFFLSFASNDLVVLLSGLPPKSARAPAFFSDAEIVILLSAACFLLGYGLALSRALPLGAGICRREWATWAIWWVGGVFWAIGFVAVFFIQTAFQSILDSPYWGPLGGVISLARLLNPVGALMLAYLALKNGSRSALAVFCFFCVMDFCLGFYGDTKEQSFRDPILFLIARLLLTGRVSVILAVSVLAVAGASFSYFAEFRDEFKGQNLSRTAALEKVLGSIRSSMGGTESSGERFSSGIEYVTARTSLKPSVELIVAKVGMAVPFQEGRTISPLQYAFVPRNFLPNKPDTTVGRKFNRAFHISADPDTYISPSQNGELYWNFGWWGVVWGMLVIGMVIGLVNRLANLEHRITLPRLLILLMTIYLVCLRFEDGIAIQYTYWMRAVVMLLLVHLVMPKAARQP